MRTIAAAPKMLQL